MLRVLQCSTFDGSRLTMKVVLFLSSSCLIDGHISSNIILCVTRKTNSVRKNNRERHELDHTFMCSMSGRMYHPGPFFFSSLVPSTYPIDILSLYHMRSEWGKKSRSPPSSFFGRKAFRKEQRRRLCEDSMTSVSRPAL